MESVQDGGGALKKKKKNLFKNNTLLNFLSRHGLWISSLWHVSFTSPDFQTLLSVRFLVGCCRGGSALCPGCLREDDWN